MPQVLISPRTLGALLALTVCVAGCSATKPATPTNALVGTLPAASAWIDVHATDPFVVAYPDMSYTGENVFRELGSVQLHLNLAGGLGEVDMNLTFPGSPPSGYDPGEKEVHWAMKWTQFHAEPNQTWQGQGLAVNVTEHGASGHDRPILPQVNASYAGWGTTHLMQDGQPFLDPLTGTSEFSARFMVTKQGVLEPGKHRILKTDGKTPFDPSFPQDGKVYPGQGELHIELAGPGGLTPHALGYLPPPREEYLKGQANGASIAQALPVHLTAKMNELYLGPSIDSGAGRLTFTFVSPAGKPLGSVTLTALASPAPGYIKLPPEFLEGGNYTLLVNGTAIAANYSVHVVDAVPPPFHFYAIFTNVETKEPTLA